jgi:hypothetical protein
MVGNPEYNDPMIIITATASASVMRIVDYPCVKVELTLLKSRRRPLRRRTDLTRASTG